MKLVPRTFAFLSCFPPSSSADFYSQRNEDIFASQVPGLADSIGFGTRADWNFSTTPQTHVGGAVLPYARAMMLGGCSSHSTPFSLRERLIDVQVVDGMIYSRGSRDDYDRWASITDDDSLSWGKIYPYILKVMHKWLLSYQRCFLTILQTEKWTDSNDPNFPEQGHFEPSLHNFHGKVGVSAPYGRHPFYDLLFETANSSKEEFPFLLDQNSGRPLGLSE